MKKFILFFVLSLLLISFGAFLINAYQLQKNYFDSKNKPEQANQTEDNTEVIEKQSFYKDYAKVDYDLALKDKSVLVLYFTSNWCDECLSQDKTIADYFSNLDTKGIVGLRIHILDSETTTETDALAKKFDITKESSLIILNKDGSLAFKNTGKLSTEVLSQKIKEVVSK
ncbi:MAG: thioredoxin domain-containing protein [Microgenomates group bacterium]